MKRKQRRARSTHGTAIASGRADALLGQIRHLFFEASEHEHAGKLELAARTYKRVLALAPDQAQACNNLARALQGLGKLNEASGFYARALALMPQLLDQHSAILETLVSVLPPLGVAMRRQMPAWPKRLGPQELFNEGLSSIAGDPLLHHVLQSTPVRDVAFERLLTSLRLSFLAKAARGETFAEDNLAFVCALARQCFINEYVFATTPEEEADAEDLKRALTQAIEAGAPVEPSRIAVVAMYSPLHAVPAAPRLLEMRWNPAIVKLLTQQLREPEIERSLRSSIPRLTPIEDRTSQDVRRQYEESPYPRWVHAAGQVSPMPIDHYLREQFSTSAFLPMRKTEQLDVLVAGCGTGQIAIASAQKYSGARVLGIDLSLNSLCYAKRNTPATLAFRIEYAQADILELGSIDRSFDVIDSCGVLHHMSDPFKGWRILLDLLRPGGLMHIGLYSEAGRGDVSAAREFIAAEGFGTTPAEIRRCRQRLLETRFASVARFTDFFTTSECRDLLFHVRETRVRIPAIAAFIAEHGLRFLGFEFAMPILQRYRNHFASSGWSLTDLARWHAFESEHPETFSGMYQFWVQRP